jgi:hypothetical protein
MKRWIRIRIKDIPIRNPDLETTLVAERKGRSVNNCTTLGVVLDLRTPPLDGRRACENNSNAY